MLLWVLRRGQQVIVFSHAIKQSSMRDWAVSWWFQGSVRCSETEVCVCKPLSRVRLFMTPWTAARQAPLFMDSPGKNTGVGCHSRGPYGWKMVRKGLSRRDSVCLGWPPSKQSLGGEILYKWLIERDLKKPVKKWGEWDRTRVPGDSLEGVGITPELSLFQPKRTDFCTLTCRHWLEAASQG